ncbi:ribonuclease H-like domain-containing protein [Tanacetum coccineum]
MNIKFRGGLLGLKRLHGFLEVTAAQVHNGNYAKAPRSKEDQFRNQDNTRKQGNKEDTYKAMLAIDGVAFDRSDMEEEQVQTNMALMVFSNSEKQYDDLLAKKHETEFKEITYKRGLDTVEAQLATYMKNEVLFSEEVVVLKREVGIKQYEINTLKTEFEKLKKEKDAIDFKFEKFDKASKDLDQLLGSQITDKSKKGFGYSAVPPLHPLIYNRPNKLDLSLISGLDEFTEPEFKGYSPSVSEVERKKVRKNDGATIIEDWVSDDEEQDEPKPKSEKKTVIPTAANIESAKIKKPVKKLVRYAEMYRSQSPRGNQRNWNGQKSNQLVLLNTGLTQFNTVRTVNIAHPKTAVHSAKSKTHFSKQAQSTAKRPFYKKPSLTNRHFNHKVNTVRPRVVNTARSYRTPVNTVRPRVVNTARPNRTSVNAARANGFNAGNPQHDDTGFVDSGCSRHMTGNIAYLSDFKQFDRGYVAFGGGAYGGKILGKDTFKTANLDFEDVYFVNELKFNLFSVSQMCDKKNYVLFTDTECLVLSPNFKLPDENQILLKIPRKDNMYSFDMKNIVPKESLTCLVAKATLDESMLWHRRLGHINFKNINKLVKDNLVRGLPTKHFENDQTCVACLKGKQHRASDSSAKCVAERRNRTLIEAARTMLADSKLPTTFWAEVVSTACYVQNRVLVVKPHNKTPYELFRGFKLALSFMRPFGCHVTILNTLDSLGKFDGKSDEGFFVGYSLSSKAFRVYNTRTKRVEENFCWGF